MIDWPCDRSFSNRNKVSIGASTAVAAALSAASIAASSSRLYGAAHDSDVCPLSLCKMLGSTCAISLANSADCMPLSHAAIRVMR